MDDAGGSESVAVRPDPAGGVGAARRRGWGRWLRRALGGLLAIVCTAWAWSGTGWGVDLAANLTAQWLGLGAVIGLAACARRRWRLGAWGGLCTLAALAGLASVPRAASVADASPGSVVRVLVLNAAPSNAQTEGLVRTIEQIDPDVLVVLETPEELLSLLKPGGRVRERLPYGWVPEKAEESFRVVVSRWPQHGGDGWEGGAWATPVDGMRVMRVDRPAGAFLLLMVHPASPRSAGRWAEGNRVLGRAADEVNTRLLPEGLPVVVAGDFNGAPPAYRSRLLTRLTGLRRAKPLWTPAGTWPSWSVWPARTAIDGVFVSAGTGVVSWQAVRAPGSDHSAVLVELSLPGP